MSSKTLRWIIWLLAALFYFYEFILRVSPSVILTDLMQKFALNASQVGILSAFYLYAYAPMQLPVGLLMDRFGLKVILSIASVVCGLGTFLFAISPDFTLAAIGRMAIGGASAFGFIAMVYVSTHFFSERKRAFLIGLANSIAMLGASCGTGPVSSVIKTIGWEVTFKWFALFGLVLGGLIYFSLRNEKSKSASGDFQPYPLKNIIGSKNIWINAIIALFFYMTTTAFAGLWGPTYLENVKGFSKEASSYGMSILFSGWLIGGPLIGLVSDFIQKRTKVIAFGILGCFISLSLVLYLQLPLYLTYICLFLIGLFSAAELLNFTLAIEMTSLKAKATAAAFTNFLVSCGDAVVQPLVGFILDLNWSGGIKEGVRVYNPKSYQIAMSILPIALLLALILLTILNNRLSKNSSKSI
jgi:sugar phosphate permease